MSIGRAQVTPHPPSAVSGFGTAPPDTTAKDTGTPPHLAFRPDIEGMRAVAVLLVVLSHIGLSTFAGGYVGVDVFFVISGFLITSLLLKELSTKGSISIPGFYARRAARLLPASTVVLIATLAAAWLWLSPIRLTAIMGDAIASALYAVNYQLAIQGTDYWASDTDPSPLQHYWSLAVEEQFYLLWPLLLMASSLIWWRRRRTINVPVVCAVLGAIMVASFVVSVVQSPYLPSFAYFGIHTRAWELAIGALIAIGAATLRRTPAPVAAVLTWGGLVAVVVSALTFTESTVFPGYAAALPVLGTAAVLAGGCATPRAGAQALLRFPPFQWIGKLSYGWYLWHWPVLMIGPYALDRGPSLKVNLALAAGSLGLAAASYVLVENPIRHRRSFRRLPSRGLALGAGLTATAVVAALAVAAFAPSMTGRGIAPDTDALVEAAADPELAVRELVADSAQEENVPANLEPALELAEDDRVTLSDEGCHLGFTDIEPSASCVFGDPDSETTVVLFGDSHAAQWFPAFQAAAQEEGWRLVSMTKSACHASSVELYNSRLERLYEECTQWRELALSEIREMEPELVVMSSIDGGSSDLVGEPDDEDEIWAAGWVESFRQAAESDPESPDGYRNGSRPELVLLLDTPRPGVHVPECLSEHLADVDECDVPTEELSRDPQRRELVAERVAAEGVTVIDPVRWFCTASECPPIIGNVLVYRDTNHISATFASVLAEPLVDILPIPPGTS